MMYTGHCADEQRLVSTARQGKARLVGLTRARADEFGTADELNESDPTNTRGLYRVPAKPVRGLARLPGLAG